MKIKRDNKKYRRNLSLFILVFFTLGIKIVFNPSQAALPINGTYNIDPSARVVWTESLFSKISVRGDSTAPQAASTLFNSIVYPGATWGLSSDGVAYGFILAHDVILVIEGTLTLRALFQPSLGYSSSGWRIVYSGKSLPSAQNYNQQGNGFAAHNLNMRFDASPGEGDRYWGVGRVSILDAWDAIEPTFSGSVSLYLGPEARTQKLTIANAMNMRFIDQSVTPIIEAGTTIDIKGSELKCTIDAPATISFGTVNINGTSANDLLAFKKQGVDISCSSDSPFSATQKMELSFIGNYSNSNWGRLNMLNDTGDQIAYIRGHYSDAGGLCAENSGNEVGFNGTNGTKTLSDIGVGTTSVPITWSLCSNGSSLLGQGSAQATINISWD